MNRRHWLLASGAAALASGAAWRAWELSNAGLPDAPLSGDTMPAEFWELDLPQAGAADSASRLALRRFQAQPLLVNFWASWCPPCVAELPALDRFAQGWATSGGGQVLGLAIDDAQAVAQFLGLHPVHYPIGILGSPGLSLMRRLGNASAGLPFSVLLSRSGAVLHRKLGATNDAELQSWLPEAAR